MVARAMAPGAALIGTAAVRPNGGAMADIFTAPEPAGATRRGSRFGLPDGTMTSMDGPRMAAHIFGWIVRARPWTRTPAQTGAH